MAMINIEDNSGDWKRNLRSACIRALYGKPQEREPACQEVGYYYMCCVPSSLYKYYDDKPEKLETIKQNRMWYSAPCNFNDVFDCDISFDEDGIFDSIIRMACGKMIIRQGSPMWKEIKRTVAPQINSLRAQWEALRSTTGITCLSEEDDSLLMWAHYANNHCGMCVEYNLLEINRQLSFTPVPVIYSDERVCIHSLDLDTLNREIQGIFIESLTSKSPEWSYEKEWRIIRDDGACADKWSVDKKGALLDMIRPSSIILGCMAKQEFSDKIKMFCEDNQVNLYRMEKDNAQYRLKKVPVKLYNEK